MGWDGIDKGRGMMEMKQLKYVEGIKEKAQHTGNRKGWRKNGTRKDGTMMREERMEWKGKEKSNPEKKKEGNETGREMKKFKGEMKWKATGKRREREEQEKGREGKGRGEMRTLK